MRSIRSPLAALAAVLLLLLLLLAACGGSETEPASACDAIVVSDGFVRVPPGDSTAFYATIRNTGKTDITLDGVSSDFAADHALHESVMEGGLMKMRPIEGGRIALPAGGEITFAPGGQHVMIMGIERPLEVGDTVSITLHFSGGCLETVDVPVKAIDR